MFTGIIQTTGFFKSISKKNDAYRLGILMTRKLGPIKDGDSLAINGACLTSIGARENNVFFDVTEETFAKTSFVYLKHNDVVNIERSLEWKPRIDGHFVLGHVDSVQKIKAIRTKPHVFIDVPIAKDDKKYIVEKGSIAIDGISFTIGEIYEDKIRIYIIPHTLHNTNLMHKKTGDWVNIEFDILGKYIQERALCNKYSSPAITEEFLKDRGFI